jgi:hypothetical protein
MNSVRLFSVITFAVLGAGQVVLPSAVVAQVPAVSQPLRIKPANQTKLKSTMTRLIAAPRTAATAMATPVIQQKKFANFTLRSVDTRDLKGVEPSLYRGAYFKPLVEEKRMCIVKRESEGYYEVRGGGGNRYFGAYQMSQELAQGATWMMLSEHKKLMGASEAKKVLAQLRKTPPNKWPRYFQDAAFSTIYNWESTGSGANHWAGGRWRC